MSRDLAAINPNLTYTIYDEVTLFLCRITGHSFEWVLAAQQVVCRFAGMLGVVLLCLSAGIDYLPALLVSTLVSAGAVLPGIHVALTDPEPVPFGFAFALTTLAFGLLANTKPLLAGLIGGIALVYQPTAASIFWLFVIGAALFRRDLRHVLRPTFPALIVFTLLLANAAQLQSGRGESHALFQQISHDWMQLQLFRTPELWLSTWSYKSLLFYLAIAAGACFALRDLWNELGPLVRAMFAVLIGFGTLTLPATFLGVQIYRSATLGEAQLLRGLAFLVLAALILFARMAIKDSHRKLRLRACLWVCPLIAIAVTLRIALPSESQKSESRSIHDISEWAERSTWGGAMFVFPDAGKSSAPGQFRGLAMRAVYSDWISGSLLDVFPTFGKEWYARWMRIEKPKFSLGHLRDLQPLPIEYVVLRREHSLPNTKAEFVTPDFVVYDTHVLRIPAATLPEEMPR